jgi:hypothetical protein
MVTIAIVAAAFPRLFEFVAATFRLAAVFTVPVDSLLQVPLGSFNAAVASIVIAIQGLGWHCAAEQEERSQDSA